MIPLLIGVFLIILFIVMAYFSASTWRGWHITMVTLTFLAGILLIVVAALSQKTHVTWKKDYDNFNKQLEAEGQAAVLLEMGDPALVESDQLSINKKQARLDRLTLDRGRVWRRCMPQGAPANNQIVISTVRLNPDGSPANPGGAQENGINQNMVLYAFREDAVPISDSEQLIVPVEYMGEFLVVDAQPTSITLTPSLPLDGKQTALVSNPEISWTLYEMMPLDSHSIFSEEDVVGRPLDNTIEQAVFGQMDEEQLRSTFARVTGLEPNAPIVSQLIAPYLKDGLAATEEDVNMHPTNIWQKLEFEQPHKERVNSNNLSPGISGSFFDADGYAEVPRLRSEGEADFRVNDIGLFPAGHDLDKQWVDGLVDKKICRRIGPVYVRTLRDYEESLHSAQERFFKRREEMARAQRDIANLNATIAKTQQQTAYRQAECEKLKEDRSGLERDNEKMDQLLATLATQKETLLKDLSTLYNLNLDLSNKLTEYSQKLTEAINRRAANVAMR